MDLRPWFYVHKIKWNFEISCINTLRTILYFSIYFISIFSCILDEDNCIECDEVQEGLEKIDDETDALDITFVKVNDPRYAKKYGVNKLPALVYFRRKFPSIYRGNSIQINNLSIWEEF